MRLLAGVVVLVISALLPAARADSSLALTEELKLLDVWIETQVASRSQPGLSIGVVYGGELLWSKSYGYADAEGNKPASADTLYRIASISKTFTATAILQLRDSGKLALTDPVSKHLPWFEIDTPYERPVTIWHLLTHTSGLPREPTGFNWTELSVPSREEMIDGIGDQQPVFEPEAEWKYSNLGFALLGEIVAAVSGQSWEEYVQANILDPLGMASTTTTPSRSEPGLATGFQRRSLGEPRATRPWMDMRAARPAGNLASNIEDMARYLAFQLSDSDDVLSAATRVEMHRVHWVIDSWKRGWGLGFQVARKDSFTLVQHGGSLPGHRSNIGFAPAYDLGVVVLTNSGDGSPMLYRDMALDLLVPLLRKGTVVDVAGADPSLARYAGRYSNAWSDVTVLEYRGALAIVEHGNGSPAQSLVKLRPYGEHAFRAVPTGLHFTLTGEVLRFEFDDNGEVARLAASFGSWQRVPPGE